ncbi:DUF4468 domain-containing protein [Chryseobacterium sp. WG14]|uniref:DUF4468 domain-containing protein n=1 Tax=Chryseobacterium sp. WG14 TaxID=2926909 RepID=UPI00211EEEEA|nr:DUF4468 domain-containing protein [Chryseobacterium sp. WG14]MCQ9638653.1 DUF4468 domain-containing protein [Chryseobacterium sp. WG14]
MTKAFTLIVMMFNLFLFSQELKYEEVVSVDSTITKQELYNRARSWIGLNFNKKTSSIDIDDKNQGEISVSGVIDYRNKKNYFGSGCVEGPIKLALSIFLKDGKYKYSFHSFNHKGSGGYGCRKTDYGVITTSEKAPQPSWGEPNDKAWKDIKSFIVENIQLNISDLKSFMNKPHESSKDW